MANLFSKRPIEVPNKSAFDLSHRNVFTTKCGTITPCLVDELLPGDKVTLGATIQAQLPPLATDFYGRVRAKVEAFFVPFRVIYGGWKYFIMSSESGQSQLPSTILLPQYKWDNFSDTLTQASVLGAGTLADYLGFKLPAETTQISIRIPNILPFLAYHKIWDDWYRDSRLQKPCFIPIPDGFGTSSFREVSALPFIVLDPISGFSNLFLNSSSNSYLYNGMRLHDLHQRCWSKDYFTNATTRPQAGDESKVSVPVTDSTGTFSIAQLRAANSLQQWKERMNISGRYGDRIEAQFGVYPSDAVTDRAIYLGSMSFDVYNKTVYQTGASEAGQNPFGDVGSKYANGMAIGESSLVDEFEAKEFGFLFVNFTLVPDAQYSSGVRRMFQRSAIGDFAWPILSGVGDQGIYNDELTAWGGYQDGDTAATKIPRSVFGYTQRYSEYKFMQDEVHGLLQSGQSLAPFALQRHFSASSVPALGTSFIEIPTSAMDNVTAVAGDISKYGTWVDTGWSYKKVSTLPAYSIPTLGDMKNTHTIVVDDGGKRL